MKDPPRPDGTSPTTFRKQFLINPFVNSLVGSGPGRLLLPFPLTCPCIPFCHLFYGVGLCGGWILVDLVEISRNQVLLVNGAVWIPFASNYAQSQNQKTKTCPTVAHEDTPLLRQSVFLFCLRNIPF